MYYWLPSPCSNLVNFSWVVAINFNFSIDSKQTNKLRKFLARRFFIYINIWSKKCWKADYNLFLFLVKLAILSMDLHLCSVVYGMKELWLILRASNLWNFKLKPQFFFNFHCFLYYKTKTVENSLFNHQWRTYGFWKSIFRPGIAINHSTYSVIERSTFTLIMSDDSAASQ